MSQKYLVHRPTGAAVGGGEGGSSLQVLECKKTSEYIDTHILYVQYLPPSTYWYFSLYFVSIVAIIFHDNS